jgi:hypothetical protein
MDVGGFCSREHPGRYKQNWLHSNDRGRDAERQPLASERFLERELLLVTSDQSVVAWIEALGVLHEHQRMR